MKELESDLPLTAPLGTGQIRVVVELPWLEKPAMYIMPLTRDQLEAFAPLPTIHDSPFCDLDTHVIVRGIRDRRHNIIERMMHSMAGIIDQVVKNCDPINGHHREGVRR